MPLWSSKRSMRTILPLVTAALTAGLSLVKLTGCGGGDEGPPALDPGSSSSSGGDTDGGEGGANGPRVIAPGPSRGSPIAISPDDNVVVTVNRDTNTVSVFKTSYPDDGSPPKMEKTAELEVGAEPWQVAIS